MASAAGVIGPAIDHRWRRKREEDTIDQLSSVYLSMIDKAIVDDDIPKTGIHPASWSTAECMQSMTCHVICGQAGYLILSCYDKCKHKHNLTAKVRTV